jgi:1,4-dihydroxy-2-naphthoate octaprenyltransferase
LSLPHPVSAPIVRVGSVAAWLAAVRPRTLPVAISPVLVGAALGWQRTGALDLQVAAIALAASLLMQVVSNLQNDVGYTVRGAEQRGNRKGLPRATALGLLGVAQVRRAIGLLIGLALLLGLPLIAERGWPVLAMGLASIAAALAYMGGPRPIAYTPLGEWTVFVFFGLVAVIGTDWVLTGSAGAATVAAAVAIGGLAAAALAWLGGSLLLLLPLALLPAAWALRRDFLRCPPGIAFNAILFRTFRLELLYAALLAAGAVLGRLAGV